MKWVTYLDGEGEDDVNLGENRFNVLGHVDFGHARVAVMYRPSTQTTHARTLSTSPVSRKTRLATLDYH